MTTTAFQPTTVGQLLKHWARTRPLEMLPAAGILLALVSFAFVAIPTIARGDGSILWKESLAHGFVLTWLLLASVTVRTIGVRDTFAAFFSGFFMCTTVTFLVVRPLRDLIGEPLLSSTLIAPPIEEAVKALPLLLILWAYHRRHYRSHGLTDMVVLGFAVGAGMAVHEEILYGRTNSSFTDSSIGFIFPTFYQYTPVSHDLFGGMFTGAPVATLLAHAGWGLVLGFGLGVASIYRRKPLVAFAFAFGAIGLTTFDHAVFNYSVQVDTWLPRLLLDHNLLVILAALIIPSAIVFDLMRMRQRPPALPKPQLRLSWHTFLLRGKGLGGIAGVLAMGHYRRGWNGLACARQLDPALPNGGHDRQLRAHLAIAYPASVNLGAATHPEPPSDTATGGDSGAGPTPA